MNSAYSRQGSHALTVFLTIVTLTLSLSSAIPRASAQALPLFLPAKNHSSGGEVASSLAVADLNGDNAPDVVVGHVCQQGNCSSNVGAVTVLLNRGDGTLFPAVSYPSGGSWVRSVAIADVNGDHKPDLIVAASYNPGNPQSLGAIGVLLGNGDGTFQSATTYESGGGGATFVKAADVNGDGKPDLIVAHEGGANSPISEIGVLLGEGDGTFQPATTYSADGWGTYSLDVIDINHDGKLDVVVAVNCPDPQTCSEGALGVLLGNGDGTLQPVVLYLSDDNNGPTLATADINGDGNPDVVLSTQARVNGDNGAVTVFLGNGDGTFQIPVSYAPGGSGPTSVAVTDVSKDGVPDVLVANYFDVTVGQLLGNKDGTLQPASTYSTNGTSPASIAIADMNRDGRPDLVVAGCPPTGCGIGQLGVLLHVGDTATATTLISGLNPSSFGQFVTFRAAVTSTFGTPTGAVKLFDGSIAMGTSNLVNGLASITVSTLRAGSHTITAVYQGSLKFSPSKSVSVIQNIKSARAATSTVVVSSLNPAVQGQFVTFTATVSSSGGVPPDYTKYVTFRRGENVLGVAQLFKGTASCTTLLPAGVSTITALYPGDATFASSISPGLLQVVKTKTQSNTTTTLASSLNPSIYGQKIMLTATARSSGSAIPTGNVVFWSSQGSDASIIAIVALNVQGVATLTKTYLNADSYQIYAVYKGDTDSGPSVSGKVYQVVKQTTSAAAVSSSLNPSLSGQSVTFTTKITSPTVVPTGPVTFTVGNRALGTAQLASGKATLTISALPVGSSLVKATYLGNSNIAQTSASLTQTVQ
jgi:Bacterial Ig-like domain (group 3)/FG-GAP-like repeat